MAVLLLYVGIVILVVGPTSRQLNALFLTPALEQPINKLTARIRMSAKHSKREFVTNVRQAFLLTVQAISPTRLLPQWKLAVARWFVLPRPSGDRDEFFQLAGLRSANAVMNTASF